ncbi:MAG: tetratricopeptide repeat protein [Rectinemataceae bacterium]
MAFGSLRKNEGPADDARAFRAVRAALALVICSLSLLSCSTSTRESRFAASLERIDAALAAGRPAGAEFSASAGDAAGGADWLSLIGRALRAESTGDRGRAADIARKALAGAPGSETVAFGAAYAFLRSGDPAAALALFPSRLSRSIRPDLWAEAVVETARQGPLGASNLDADAFSSLGAITDDPRLYISAAVKSLAERNSAGAGTWLERAIEGGATPDVALMWDCGLFEELAARSDAGAGPEELCIMGDAAWRIGDFAAAQERWERALALNPRVSWKAYLKLALLAGTGTELQTSYFARLHSSFVDLPQARADPEAVAAYAAFLARSGAASRALTMLEPYSQNEIAGALALTIEGMSWPEDRLVSAAENFAAVRPQSGRALGFAMRILFERGRFADMAVLYRAGEARGLIYPYRWYYGAAIDAAYGRYSASAAKLEAGEGKAPASDAGPCAYFALGTLDLRSGNAERAIDYLSKARDSASEGKSRCAVLKELGRAHLAAGDREEALASWREALRSDPRDPEAALLARGLPGAADK